MEQGKKYLIVYRFSEQRFDRCAVMKFLSKTDDVYQFDARPIYGTQQLEEADIKAIYTMPDDAKIVLNQRYDERVGGLRVL